MFTARVRVTVAITVTARAMWIEIGLYVYG